jgi:hydrogenase 3 maturation protease
MGLLPGEVCPLSEDAIANQFIFTTHDMPLSFLIEALKEFVPRVHFIGIQPDVVAFAYPMSSHVRQAVETVYEQLQLDGWNSQ